MRSGGAEARSALILLAVIATLVLGFAWALSDADLMCDDLFQDNAQEAQDDRC